MKKSRPIFVCMSINNSLLPYCIARLDPKTSDYVPLKGQLFSTKEEAEEVSKEMNEEYLKESSIE